MVLWKMQMGKQLLKTTRYNSHLDKGCILLDEYIGGSIN